MSQSPEQPVPPQPGAPRETDATAATEEQPAGAPAAGEASADPADQSGSELGSAAGAEPGGQAAEKPTSQWATGDEPMTGPQASYLSTLAREAGEEVPADLTKAQASDMIERLQARSGRVQS